MPSLRTNLSIQSSLILDSEFLFREAVVWANSEQDKGQIYTKPEVVKFMVTAIGLNSSEDFKSARILEPSCGEGDFVVEIVDRLINQQSRRIPAKQLANKLLAVDLVKSSVDIARNKVASQLNKRGYNEKDISYLLDSWFRVSDFLLENLDSSFTHIIGNPPYVRVENVPKYLLSEYRRRFITMTDRADLYVAFFEKCLCSLSDGGRLSFICTDRWTKNIYGRSLREFISEKFNLELYIDLYGVEAFESKVMTYPAITQIQNSSQAETIIKDKTDFTEKEAERVISAIEGSRTNLRKGHIVDGGGPWLHAESKIVSVIQKLEKCYPAIEGAGCKVFIGAATGSNKAYIVDADIRSTLELDRTLPTITAKELKSGSIEWNENYLINTYDDNGVIDLKEYPKLENHLMRYKEQLCGRHVAKKDQGKWFKTIDRVYAERAKKEKLLIPDIGNEPIVLYDSGKYHPNNSIYYICSDEWDLHALRVVLLSNITKMFISTYSTRIAKGYLRYQAQHLRKLRIPHWEDIDSNLRNKLSNAGKKNSTDDFDSLTGEMYNLSKSELATVRKMN